MADKPKRPMSAYMLWLNSAREEIKSQHPGLKVTEIAKKGGEMWRAMKDKTVGSEIAVCTLFFNIFILLFYNTFLYCSQNDDTIHRIVWIWWLFV